MPLDPLLAFALMLLLWTAGIAYTIHKAALEKRGLPKHAKHGPN